MSLAFGVLFALPNGLSVGLSASFGRGETLLVCVGLIASAMLTLLFLDRISGLLECRLEDRRPPAFSCRKRFWFVCFALLEASFVFVLLANFPGFCTVDSNDVVDQVLGTSHYSSWHRYDGLSNHHPVFYTFCVWVVFQATSFLGSVDASVFCFLLVQLTFVAWGCAWSLSWLNARSGSRLCVVLAAAFYLLSPVLAAHAPLMWKDVPFAIVVVVLVLKLFDFSRADHLSRKDVAVLFALLSGLCLLRNNGLYVSLAVLAYLLAVFPAFRKGVFFVLVALVAGVFVLQGPVFHALSIEKGHFSESVGVPLQQVAAVVAQEGDLTEAQEEFLNQVIPLDEMADLYTPSVVNPIKFSEDFDDAFLESHKMEFLAVWLQLLPENVATYVKAWAAETQGYWEWGYRGPIGDDTTLRGADPVSLVGVEWNPSLLSDGLAARFPLLFSMGSVVWLVVAAVFLCAMRKRSLSVPAALACFVPLLALLLTLFAAAPIAADFRYVLPLYLSIPFLVALVGAFEGAGTGPSRVPAIGQR